MEDFENDRRNRESERRSLLPGDIDRRQVLTASLAAGFAAAVRPAAAQKAIVTDANGLTAGDVKIPLADAELPAYRAMPATGGPFPVSLVVQEIFGVHEHIRDVCRLLAKQGYMAIAAELYFRQGSVAGLTNINDVMEVVSKVPDAQVVSDLDASVAFARASGRGDTARLGITGFCWGGRIVWLYAAHGSALKAGVAWYGRLVGDATKLTPRHPIELVGELKAPVLGLYGGADLGIPVETVDRMREACKRAGKTCELVVYPDTPHAFNADYRPSYRPAAAKDGWARMLAWFRTNGVA
jgi:carboxymethylenebutenolidase